MLYPTAISKALLTDPADEKTGMRLRTLADRINSQEKEDFSDH